MSSPEWIESVSRPQWGRECTLWTTEYRGFEVTVNLVSIAPHKFRWRAYPLHSVGIPFLHVGNAVATADEAKQFAVDYIDDLHERQLTERMFSQ